MARRTTLDLLLTLLLFPCSAHSNGAPAPPPGTTRPAVDASTTRSVGGSEDWWRRVTATIERGEYQASPTKDGLQAPNRAQDLRTYFFRDGIQIVPRQDTTGVESWRFGWRTSRWGRPDHMRAVEPTLPVATDIDARVIYAHPGFDEWYENRKEGIEQGFTVQTRPPGDGALQIEGRLETGLRAERQDDGAVSFLNTGGTHVLRYAGLHAWDTNGQRLASRLEVDDGELRIVVDDRAANYPITIDPLLTSPVWTVESDQALANLGWSVATAGDVNGDGFSDVIVAAQVYDNGLGDEGRAYVYHGSPAGPGASPAWTATGDQLFAYFGSSVNTAGDVNGDGFSDVIVGAYVYSNGEGDEGRAYVFHGSEAGLAVAPAWIAESNQASALFGASVGTAGDVNGDGYADVVVGSPFYDNGQADEGRAFVYLGSATGLAISAAWTAESNQAGAELGWSVWTAGDVNGDGYADVIAGAYQYDNGQDGEGRAFVYHGSATGLGLAPAWTAESDQAFAYFGRSVGTAGDVNGDGYADVIVGAPGYDIALVDEGRVVAYYGSPTGLNPGFSWIATGDKTSASFGRSVGTAGDVNGDGFADVIVGIPNDDNGQTDEGRAQVFQGSNTGLSLIPVWTGESDQASSLFGWSVGTAGDVNGDGFSDILVGAIRFDNGESDEGRAFLYRGSASGPATSPAWNTESDQTSASFGWSLGTAGDVNGDGFSDVIVGANSYDNGQPNEGRAFVYHGSATGLPTSPAWTAESNQASAGFGWSTRTAGDVNGDGYSDVIIGAYSFQNIQAGEGRAYVYHGSATGLGLSPAWTAEIDQANAHFGNSVGTAGDVNGDGFSDVIVGAVLYDNGEDNEGRAYVYHGAVTGLGASPAWTAESNQISAFFGYSVGTAGDVNGDGFSDVIVGAHAEDNGQADEGQAFVFHGSASGLALSPAWTGESDQAGANFGYFVGTAGDVNGDGYSDVLIGAKGYDNGQSDEGRAFVYQGSATGLSLSSSWSAESDQADAQFGTAGGAAGDVNGDGFSDVIVGAPYYDNGQSDEGRAYIYHGSASGLAAAPAWTAESNQADATFGFSAANAGDVNGDGFSDVLVGAFQYDGGQLDEGRAFLYYGNGGDGLDRLPRQVRTDDAAPIQPLGLSDSPSAFRLKARGRTAAGRGKVGLQYEVKPLGVAFEGTGLITGPLNDTGVPVIGTGSAVTLSQLVGGLAAGSPYHWRLRLVTDAPLFPRSRWLSLPYNAITEAAVRTGGTLVGVGEPQAVAPQKWLEASTPNPFTRTTRINYTLPAGGRVLLEVYDIAGHQVAVLADGVQEAGRHSHAWDGRRSRGDDLPLGVYFVRLTFAGRSAVRKVVRIR